MKRKTFLIRSGKAILGSSLAGTLHSLAGSHSGCGKSTGSLTLFLGGDVMTGRGIDQILSRSVDPILQERYVKDARQYVKLAEQKYGAIPDKIPYDYIWGDALAELKQIVPNACIINLETAVTTSDQYWKRKGIHYRMHPENTSILTAAGIDVCVLGNNHVLDWGPEGLRQTLSALHKAGLKTAGAGENKQAAASPAVIRIAGKSGRLLVFSYGLPGAGVPLEWAAGDDRAGVNVLRDLSRESAKQVIKHIRQYKKKNDRTIISIHWGGNWGYEVPDRQQDFAHRLIDSGVVDIIHGHSSHHPKPIERYNGRLILYGCGDLINDYEGISGHEQFRGDLPLMYFPALDEEGKLTSLRMAPMQIRQFQLHSASEENTRWLKDTLNRICEPFGTSAEVTPEGRLDLKW